MNIRKLLVRPELGAFVAAVAIFVFFVSMAGEGFLSISGTINYLEVAVQVGIVAVAVSLLMIAGEFDLSVGSMIGASGMIIALAVTQFGWPPWASIILAFLFSLVVGYVNGWLVVKTKLPSFIITLASMFLLRGLTIGFTLLITNVTRASVWVLKATRRARANRWGPHAFPDEDLKRLWDILESFQLDAWGYRGKIEAEIGAKEERGVTQRASAFANASASSKAPGSTSPSKEATSRSAATA